VISETAPHHKRPASSSGGWWKCRRGILPLYYKARGSVPTTHWALCFCDLSSAGYRTSHENIPGKGKAKNCGTNSGWGRSWLKRKKKKKQLAPASETKIGRRKSTFESQGNDCGARIKERKRRKDERVYRKGINGKHEKIEEVEETGRPIGLS